MILDYRSIGKNDEFFERVFSIANSFVITEYNKKRELGSVKETMNNIKEFKKSDEYKKQLKDKIKDLSEVIPKEYDFRKDFIKIRISKN